jgi:hypothetical protein
MMPNATCSDASADLKRNKYRIAFFEDQSQCLYPYCLLL